MRIALVGVLGAAGALSRYAIGTAVGVTSFPWATLAINVVGAFLLGVVLVAGPVRWDEDLVVAVGVGFLGAFTTFSTFGVETHTLLRDERVAAAAAYVVASVVLGVAAAALGWSAGRAWTPDRATPYCCLAATCSSPSCQRAAAHRRLERRLR